MSYTKNRLKIELNDIYLTVEEAADYIRVHPDSIYRLINDGIFILNKHYYRPKGLKIIRIKKSALDENGLVIITKTQFFLSRGPKRQEIILFCVSCFDPFRTKPFRINHNGSIQNRRKLSKWHN